MKVVKKYRFSGKYKKIICKFQSVLIPLTIKTINSVIRGQILCKQFLAIRNAQLQLLLLYWGKLEQTWWTNRKNEKNASNSSLDEKYSASKKAKA